MPVKFGKKDFFVRMYFQGIKFFMSIVMMEFLQQSFKYDILETLS